MDPRNLERQTNLDSEVALAISVARRMRPPMKVFAGQICREMGWRSLSCRAVYAWEAGHARVPAVALLAAAQVTHTSVDELLAKARNLERLGLRPGE